MLNNLEELLDHTKRNFKKMKTKKGVQLEFQHLFVVEIEKDSANHVYVDLFENIVVVELFHQYQLLKE